MRKEWTKEEVDLLVSRYSSDGPVVLGRQLDRTMQSVCKKARKLGLSRGVSAGNNARKNSWEFSGWSYDLGYIVGVYLGDGNIYKGRTSRDAVYFRHASIDKEFCEATKDKIEQITGYSGSIKWVEQKKQYVFTFANRDFVEWLGQNFGWANNKRIQVLPSLEANKGMLEGLTDSEGTISKYTTIIRMKDNLYPIETICNMLGIAKGRMSKGNHLQKSTGLFMYSISNKEYTQVGLRTYIKRKAKNGILLKES